MKRGDVVLVRFPHPSGQRGKKRPAVIVQSDAYDGIVTTLVVAEVTKNLSMVGDPACLLIEVGSIDGQSTGLVRDSVVSCLVLATINAENVASVLGTLSPTLKHELDSCLRRALDLR